MEAIEASYKRLQELVPDWLGDMGIEHCSCTIVNDPTLSAASVIHVFGANPVFVFNHAAIWDLDDDALHAILAHEVGHIRHAEKAERSEYEKAYALAVHAEKLACYRAKLNLRATAVYFLATFLPIVFTFALLAIIPNDNRILDSVVFLTGVAAIYVGFGVGNFINNNRHKSWLYRELHEMEYFCDDYAAKHVGVDNTIRMLEHIAQKQYDGVSRVRRAFLHHQHGLTHPSWASRVKRISSLTDKG